MPAPTLIPSLRNLSAEDLIVAAALVGRSMCDNPVNVRAFRQSATSREKALERFFKPVLAGVYERGSIIGAFVEDSLVGVCCMTPPGRCQPNAQEKLRILPAVLLGNSIGTAARVLSWTSAWSHHDPSASHWHLGPVAVEPRMQGRGIGGALLDDFCQRMDRYGAHSYLETDKSENVRFYQKFEFEVIAQASVLEVPNWFMLRKPRLAT